VSIRYWIDEASNMSDEFPSTATPYANEAWGVEPEPKQEYKPKPPRLVQRDREAWRRRGRPR
jgi:hypothetical protein